LCNFAYWHALAATEGSGAPLVQFIHVPTVRRGATRPGPRRRLTSADLARAGEAILMALIMAARVRRRRPMRMQPAAAAVPVEAQPKQRRVG